ncbi:MAG TPA: FtsX-like permease family protein [Ktedonobacterales bacterium]|nr:FtsX-like permease family protein [Ktedonobacterales bacterium]
MRLDVQRQGETGGGRSPNAGKDSRAPVIWQRKRSSLVSSGRLAEMRLAHGWALLLAVAVGILVAVVLICTVPLYNTLVSDIQLQHALAGAGPVGRNISATVESDHITAALRTSADNEVRALARGSFGPYTNPQPSYSTVSTDMVLIQTPTYTYGPTNGGVSQAPHVTFGAWDYTEAAPHIQLLSGALPQSSAAPAQAIITSQTAHALNLKVGDQLTAGESGDATKQVVVQVVGVWQPKDTGDPYWNGASFDAGGSVNSPPVYPVLVTQDDFFSRVSAVPSAGMRQSWLYFTRSDGITTSNMGNVGDAIGRFRSQLNANVGTEPGIYQVGVGTALDTIIIQLQSQLNLLGLPLYVIVAQVVGLALLFVAAMASLLIEGQSQEIATLKSRGASGTQLMGAFVFQAAVVALLAAIAGPFLAALLGVALIRWFEPSAASGVSASYIGRIAQPGAVIVPAVIGAALGVGAVAFSAFQSSRMDVLAFRREQARATRQPIWRRYYLDIVLAVLCVVGYVELGQFGNVNTRQQLSSGGQSPLLLVTPALLLLAGALLVLRIFPLGAGLGARVAARRRGITSLLALSSVERNPAKYSRMTLLLVLSVGLGLFALTFDTSLQRNVHDRVTYEIGADMRTEQLVGEGNGMGGQVLAKMESLPGVTAATPAYRTQATVRGDSAFQQVDLLGIDPATFGQVAGPVSWRPDYAKQSLSALLATMRAKAQGADAGNSDQPLWALVSPQFATAQHLNVGDRFTIDLSDTPFNSTALVVGGIVSGFPTLYPTHQVGSFVVTNENDLFTAIKLGSTTGDLSLDGPNEFWLRTTSNAAQHQALLSALADPRYDVQKSSSLPEALAAANANPVSSGMRGLLLVGAVTAGVLAILGSIVQSLLAARQRVTQFAVLRTVGMEGRQLTGLLLSEQLIVYLFGLVCGTILGLLLVTATLPFLQFSDTTVDPSKLGVPSYALTFNGAGTGLFYLALLLAFAFALVIAARFASTIGLGKALRLGED